MSRIRRGMKATATATVATHNSQGPARERAMAMMAFFDGVHPGTQIKFTPSTPDGAARLTYERKMKDGDWVPTRDVPYFGFGINSLTSAEFRNDGLVYLDINNGDVLMRFDPNKVTWRGEI